MFVAKQALRAHLATTRPIGLVSASRSGVELFYSSLKARKRARRTCPPNGLALEEVFAGTTIQTYGL